MRYEPISPKCKNMLHGGDYNPDQWMDTPEVWDEDLRLMKVSGCNAMSIGIFSWSALEPEEGRFELGWLDTIMDKLAENNAYAVLATPSGSKPAWLSKTYPEVCRVNGDQARQLHGGRHNHCRTSPVYREKCTIINTNRTSVFWEAFPEADRTDGIGYPTGAMGVRHDSHCARPAIGNTSTIWHGASRSKRWATRAKATTGVTCTMAPRTLRGCVGTGFCDDLGWYRSRLTGREARTPVGSQLWIDGGTPPRTCIP